MMNECLKQQKIPEKFFQALDQDKEYVIYFFIFLFSPLCRHLDMMKERNLISLT